jgi:hypothetical protein
LRFRTFLEAPVATFDSAFPCVVRWRVSLARKGGKT